MAEKIFKVVATCLLVLAYSKFGAQAGGTACVDLDNEVYDSYGDGCWYYNNYPDECGTADDEDFKANDLCCACKDPSTTPSTETSLTGPTSNTECADSSSQCLDWRNDYGCEYVAEYCKMTCGLCYWEKVASGDTGYFKSMNGQDCSAGTIIGSEVKCREAAAQLKLTYSNDFYSTERPAGCFIYLDSYTVYYNSIITPSMTSPDPITFGICKDPTATKTTPAPKDVCTDIDNGKVDSYGEGCKWYDANADQCGSADDEDFDAAELCCSCKASCEYISCQNGGTCTNYNGEGLCTCTTGFEGKYCQIGTSYNKVINTYCDEGIDGDLEVYSSLAAAKLACTQKGFSEKSGCSGVFDQNCDGNYVKLCHQRSVYHTSSDGHCTYQKE